MKVILKCVFLIFSLTIFSLSSMGAEKAKGPGAEKGPGQTKAKVSAKKKLKKKKIGVDQTDFMPDANSWGLITSYGVSYNELEQVDLKTVRHRASLAATYSFDKHWSAYSAVGVSHETSGSKIFRENDTDDFHDFSNLNIGVVYSKMAPLSFVNRSSNTLNIGLPVSERSQIDDHIANLSFTNFMQSYSWNNFFLFNRFSGNYLWHTQKFSTFNDDRINRDWLLSNSLGVTYMIIPRLGARFNYRLDSVRTLDGIWDLSFGSNLSVFGNFYRFQVFASMINDSYPENERIDLGFYDKYRRVFLGGVTYVF